MIKQGKVWGCTSPIFKKNDVKVDRAVIDGGHQCSKHRHPHSYNMFFVERGKIKVLVWKNDYDLVDETVLCTGESITIAPGEYHRFIGEAEESVVYEVYWIELTDDIEREDCGGVVE